MTKKESKKHIRQLEQEAAYWDSRKGEKNLWENLTKEGWVTTGERFVRAPKRRG